MYAFKSLKKRLSSPFSSDFFLNSFKINQNRFKLIHFWSPLIFNQMQALKCALWSAPERMSLFGALLALIWAFKAPILPVNKDKKQHNSPNLMSIKMQLLQQIATIYLIWMTLLRLQSGPKRPRYGQISPIPLANQDEKQHNFSNLTAIKMRFRHTIATSYSVQIILLRSRLALKQARYGHISLLRSLFNPKFILFQLFQVL